jgi:hypothetical protein
VVWGEAEVAVELRSEAGSVGHEAAMVTVLVTAAAVSVTVTGSQVDTGGLTPEHSPSRM